MESNKNTKLKDEIFQIVSIYLIAKDCLQYCKYLSFAETPEERLYLNTSKHFKLWRNYLWRLCVIESAKLVSSKRNDEYRIVSFIEKLKISGEYEGANIAPDKINKWEQTLKDNAELIDNIIKLRDKLYAHTDKDRNNHTKNVSISFPQVETLFSIIEDVIREIYFTVYQSAIVLDSPGYGMGRFDIIKTLAKTREESIKPMVDLLNELEGKNTE